MAEFNMYHDLIDLSAVRELCVTHGELREYAKGEAFLSQGTFPTEFGYVETGYMKFVVYSSDGEERVVGFSFDNDYVCDINSNLIGLPSEISIIAGRPSRVWVIGMDRFVRFAMSSGLWFCVGVQVALFRTVYSRYLDIYRLTPRERYLKLLTAYPDLFRKVALRDIASWLRITPVHLSRLRRQLNDADDKSEGGM